jgi:hypothetical protein
MIKQNMYKCYHFSQSAIVIIFMFSFSLVHILCYHLCYLFRVLSFMLSFDVIIFHGQQMLSFLCYFPLNIFCVIFMLSFDVNMNDNTLKIIERSLGFSRFLRHNAFLGS